MSLLRIIFIISLYASLEAYRPYPAAGTSVPDRIKWLVERSSSLRIAGSTNINSFCCQVNEYIGLDTIASVKGNGQGTQQSVPLTGALSISIQDFNCNNRMMTSEFKNTLKYRQYPQLRIVFVNLERMPSFGDGAETLKGCVEVELRGISRKFDISYSSCRTGEKEMELVGSRTFGFSDFGLTPPRKMAGLVRVNDRLDVQFHLQLRQLN